MSRCFLPSFQLSLLLLIIATCSLLQAASGQPVWEACSYGVDTDQGYVSWDLTPLSYTELSFLLPNTSTTVYFTSCGVVQQPNCTAAVDPLQPVFCLQTAEPDGSVSVEVLSVLGITDPWVRSLTGWFAGDPWIGEPEQRWPPASQLWNAMRRPFFNSSTGYTELYVCYICNASASAAFISDVTWQPYNWSDE